MSTEGAPSEYRAHSKNGELALWIRGDVLAKQRHKPRKKTAARPFPKIGNLAAALYWTVRFILLLWDKLTR